SGSPERRPRSEWPIWSTTSNALSSYARLPSHDRLVLGTATHSTHCPIAIRLNQWRRPRHAENKSLIEPSSWQRCVVHFYRNVFSHVPATKVREVSHMLKAIHRRKARTLPRGKLTLSSPTCGPVR